MLKVILQNLGCQCRHDLGAWGLHGTDDFSATHNFGGGESGDLNGQDQVDFKLHVRLKAFFGMKQHAGAADVFRGPFTPALFAHRTIAQGEVKVEALRAERREFSQNPGAGACGIARLDIATSWGSVAESSTARTFSLSEGSVKGFWSRVMP